MTSNLAHDLVVNEPAGAVRSTYPPRSAVIGWVLFDWAAQPYFTLITTFVFAPYFATHVAPDPATGQSLWGFATAAAGLIIALLSPVLGAVADAGGRRKPWIAAFGALLVIGSALLWIGRPGDPTIILPVLLAFGVATIGAEFATVFNNAMMPTLVPPEKLGRLSGTGWATGYIGGIVSLVLVLGFLAANVETDKTLLGFSPLFGLDPATHQGDRITGPLTGLWFVIFVLPMFLLTPDHAAKAPALGAVREGLRELRETLTSLPRRPVMATFLIANMVYTDALIALFAFGGIYAAGTFGWQTIQIGSFGILLACSGTIGAWLGGKLDDRFGPKRVITGSMLILLTAIILILSIDRETLLFVIKVAPPEPGEGLFAAPAEQAYLLLGFFIGLAAGPLQAASRTLLVRLAPRERITQYFGLFALSGKVTSFLAPLAVGIVTAITSSQKAGMAMLVLFFLAGLALLSRVQDPTRRGESDL
ncbi:MAG: MFS transporter [Afipia sp.]|nr:MFS transporter [Afipia sp.]OJW63145.1 MAG: MFS transporter [Afipia sp. 64-13]